MLWTLQQNPWNEFDKLSREIDSIFNGQARAKKVCRQRCSECVES